MRNTLLIIRREYLERVRTKGFIIFTLLMPLFVAGIVVLPSKMMMLKSNEARNIAVVTSSPVLGEAVAQQLTGKTDAPKDDESRRDASAAPEYKVTPITAASEADRDKVNQQLKDGKFDGYLWMTDDAIAAKKMTYTTKHASDFIDFSTVKDAANRALMRTRLVAQGISSDKLDSIFSRLDMDIVGVDKSGKESKGGGFMAFMLPFVLMFMIYMTVLIYGMAVMRSVLHEKTSRVMEVMLSSATAKQLMAGKIAGVGAVGITQILIWLSCVLVLNLPVVAAAQPLLKDVHLPLLILIFFPIFFVLGYLIYSTMYAALGAMVNSEEEAQQLQWPVLMPLILCSVFASWVIRDPNSPFAFWASLFPLTSPILMFVRIAVQPPPIWQILTSVGLLVIAIWGMVWICSRIYRVGILMYGKRPTLPEIMKWIRYS